MKGSISAIIFALAIIIASVVLGNAVINRNRAERTISVTGLGKADFTSDLIVWDGRFTKENTNLQLAYAQLEEDKKVVTEYLIAKGIDKNQLVFSAVQTRNNTRPNYSATGNYTGEEFIGYILEQNIQVNSRDVEKVEKIS